MSRIFMAALLTVLAFTSVYADDFVRNEPDRLIIVLKDNVFPEVSQDSRGISVDVPSLDAMISRYDVSEMSRTYDWFEGEPERSAPDFRLHWNIVFNQRNSLDSVIAAYEALPEVDKVFPVGVYKQRGLPNDVQSNQWYLRNMDAGGKDVRAVGGWGHAMGDTNVIIAIVDSGIDWQHPDLGGDGPNYTNGCIKINWDEFHGTPGHDDDGNGKIDDFRGWDFVTGVTGYPDEDVSTPDNDPMDYGGHGTNCAGCSAASTDNGTGIAGVAWGCKVMGVRVGWLPNGETQGVVRMDFASAGMVYAAQNGAKIINCSWGSSSYLSYAVQYCTLTQGAIVVNAAGNDNHSTSEYLGTHANVISVAATNQDDTKASFSNYGSWVEVSAPGVAIYTTAWNQAAGTHTYASVQGTSFSSPITCGALGLLWSAYPGYNRSQITNLLLNNCDEIDSVNPTYAGQLGAGRINLLKALGDNFHIIPDELPTMFDAVNSAADGDTVAVAGGTILDGPITFLNTEMPILGGWDASFTSRDPINNPTIIQASAANAAMLFEGGVGNGTVVDGFKLIGGGGQYFSGIPVDGYYGGGLVLNQTSPTLRNIQITGCAVGEVTTHGSGGGAVLKNSNAILENVDVYGNSANEAAGIYIYQGSPTLTDCDIYDNTINTDNLTSTFLGGGIAVRDANVTMTNCTVTGHIELDNGGGIYAENYLGTTILTMTDCTVSNNSAITAGCGIWSGAGTELTFTGGEISGNFNDPTAVFSNGGGIYSSGNSFIDGTLISGNSSHAGSGAMFSGNPVVELLDNLFVDNSAAYFGGVSLANCGSAIVVGNTVAGNYAGSGGAGFHNTGCAPAFDNNLAAFNTGGVSFANGFSVNSTAATFGCNDAYGNEGADYSGTTDPTGSNGNISEDPLFCDAAAGDYGLTEGSPCIDGGCGQIGALGEECTGGPSAVDPEEVPLVFSVKPNYPNPFNPMTTISFSLPATAQTSVRVYDSAGRLVRTLINQELESAVHEVTWPGRDDDNKQVASGVYFYSVISGEYSHTGRMALIK